MTQPWAMSGSVRISKILLVIWMIDTSIMDYKRSITFDNGICAEFNEESLIMFYNEDDELIMMLDPSDLSTLYHAYRGMIREHIDAMRWRGV